jgi:electron transport complex protein RnfB
MSADPALLAARIDALLPQTQCRRCGFDGCRPYAQALAAGTTQINRCPPGGTAVIGRLAVLLGRPALPLDPDCGREQPRQVAWIDEAACIGCARCLDDCPTDAIIGARKRMHTVIAMECTGCELCLPLCPVDCIHLSPALSATVDESEAARFRRLHDARRARLARNEERRQQSLRASLGGDGSAQA